MKKCNKGSITVEASLVLPIFLFFLYAMVNLYMLLFAEMHIHQSLAEAAGYIAQYTYLQDKLEHQVLKKSMQSSEERIGEDRYRNGKEDAITTNILNYAVLVKQFQLLLGDDFYVKSMISGGEKGILLSLKEDIKNPKLFYVTASYSGKISVPLLGQVTIALENQIQKKAMLGYSLEEKEAETYVYITPNQSVYHVRRNCTHLQLSIHSEDVKKKGHYTPCAFCGKEENKDGKIYISKTSDTYHNNKNCSGLKRSVKRVNKVEASGLSSCSRCGKVIGEKG